MRNDTIGIVLATFWLLLAGCVHKYAVPAPASMGDCVPANAIVYVATPPNGKDDRNRTYEKSGSWTSAAIAQALADRGVRASVGTLAGNLKSALENASAEGAEFTVFPRIVHWSDRATEWSGIPDRLTLRVVFAEVEGGRIRDDREIRASSRWLTFGGDHPQELLPALAGQWAEYTCR